MTANGKATIPSKDQKLLWARSQNACAFPNCGQPLTKGEGPEGVVVGVMAHINGEKQGAPRWDAGLRPDYVNSYANLVLLCPTHHTIVDKEATTYTVDVLKRMKEAHEDNTKARHCEMTEFEGTVSVKAKDGDAVTGARITKPTRIRSGSSFSVETENVRTVTGLHIGGE